MFKDNCCFYASNHCVICRSSEAETLEEKHLAAMRKLQEEHTDSLGKIGDLATELER